MQFYRCVDGLQLPMDVIRPSRSPMFSVTIGALLQKAFSETRLLYRESVSVKRYNRRWQGWDFQFGDSVDVARLLETIAIWIGHHHTNHILYACGGIDIPNQFNVVGGFISQHLAWVRLAIFTKSIQDLERLWFNELKRYLTPEQIKSAYQLKPDIVIGHLEHHYYQYKPLAFRNMYIDEWSQYVKRHHGALIRYYDNFMGNRLVRFTEFPSPKRFIIDVNRFRDELNDVIENKLEYGHFISETFLESVRRTELMADHIKRHRQGMI